MDDVFLKLVNLSISASWLILAVLVLRVVLKKAPKWVMPLLWGVVALRLVCLFSIESALSLIPSAETIPSEIVTETREPVLYEQACEGRWQGHAPNYMRVAAPGADLHNQVLPTRITGVAGELLMGELL